MTDAMVYSLMGGGKRIRPILCLAACEAVGGSCSDALPFACAIEMIHTYSLIHDDLPAMDDDTLRRGRPTCHVAFDEATAILAGDALLTLAFHILSTHRSDRSVDADTRLKVISLISEASGHRGMIEGQMRDLMAEGNPISAEELKDLHRLKTGAVIEASIVSGAVVGRGKEGELSSLRRYARNIGLAFQIRDDILNVEGDPKQMGKSTGTDRLHLKGTYPALLGLDQAKAMAAELVDRALQSIRMLDNRSDPLRAVAEYIVKRDR